MKNTDLKQEQLHWKYLEEQKCWFLGKIVYCDNPENSREQCMNIYVPEEYLDKAGRISENGRKAGFMASSAPVIFENGLAGYMQAEPFALTDHRAMGEEAIREGFVYVSCGCRGRSSVNEQGILCGKAPVSVADLKAGIRFLRKNKKRIPGNMERIISVGISAGGAMSTLLGCTGDSHEYDQELEKMGAVLDETDTVFGAQCYCPITDLDYADFAYEWMFQGESHYTGMPFVGFGEGQLSPFCKALSEKMGDAYRKYFNDMKLLHPITGESLMLEGKHNGSGVDYLKMKLEQSAERYATFPTYSWLQWNGRKAEITSIGEMEKDYHKRMKLCPAFDDLDLIQAENQEFGTPKEDKRHFNTELALIMEELKTDYPGEVSRYLKGYKKIIGDKELERQKYLLNPLNFIPRKGEKGKTVLAPHYRIRVGAKDADTSLTVTMVLALRLMETGKTDVDYEIVWDEPHGRADYPGEMCDWVRKICQM